MPAVIRLRRPPGLKPLSSPVSVQITSCVFHSDGRHRDVTAVCHQRGSSASLLSLPGSDLKGGEEDGGAERQVSHDQRLDASTCERHRRLCLKS